MLATCEACIASVVKTTRWYKKAAQIHSRRSAEGPQASPRQKLAPVNDHDTGIPITLAD